MDDDDLEEAGGVIKANTSIEYLELECFRETDIAKYQPLFLGLSLNKSIKDINVDGCDICEELLQIFHGESIRKLYFRECDITVDVFSVVSQMEKLHLDITFNNCVFKLDARSTQRSKSEASCKGLNMDILEISDTNLGKEGCNTLSRFLLKPNARLKTICIINSLQEKWDHSGLKGCKSLENLEYRNGGQNLQILLSSVLPDLTLRELDLSCNEISANAARAILDGITKNSLLKTLPKNR